MDSRHQGTARHRVAVRLTARRLAAARLAAAAAVVMTVAGCVSMASSGPPGSYSANQTAPGQNQDYVGPFPAPPEAGLKPEQVVEGFLAASASYSTDRAVTEDYLTPGERQTWNPRYSATVFSKVQVNPPRELRNGAQQVQVTVTGTVQATLNGSGLYFSAAKSATANSQSGACTRMAQGDSSCQFTLVKSAGQWRIASLPPYLLFNKDDFDRVYQSQDVYFFDPSYSVLVPETVFVPLGTSAAELLQTLVETLKSGPGVPWLNGAAVTGIPLGTTVRSVTVSGTAAIVDLGGAITHADQGVLERVSAQLAWTLTGSPGGQSPIQVVSLEIDGSPWLSNGTAAQTQAMYTQYDPYPSNAGSFAFVDGSGTAQSRCGSVQDASAGPATAVFTSSGAGRIATCVTGAAAPTTQPTSQGRPARPGNNGQRPAVSMAAVSPDGGYVATVSSGHDTVSVYSLGKHAVRTAMGSEPGITSISWDRQHDLWMSAQDGRVWMMQATTTSPPVPVVVSDENAFIGNVSALSIAPDGVRVAMIVNQKLELAAIARNEPPGAAGQPTRNGQLGGQPSISDPGVPLGPTITDPFALTWYDANDLIVLDRTGSGSQLEEVPVNGRTASQPSIPVGGAAKSIAADSAANFIAVGLANGNLEVSASFTGTWQPLGPGSAPAYEVSRN